MPPQICYGRLTNLFLAVEHGGNAELGDDMTSQARPRRAAADAIRADPAPGRAGLPHRLRLPRVAFNRKVGVFAGIEAAPDGEILAPEEWQRRQGEWLPTDVDKTDVRWLMLPVLERGKIAAWIAPPRNGINGQPFDFDYVHL
jgi:hypothetical protein